MSGWDTILSNVPYVLDKIINFDQLLEYALEKDLITDHIIASWDSSRFTERDKKVHFFNECSKNGPGSVAKLTAALLQSKNFEVNSLLKQKGQHTGPPPTADFHTPSAPPLPVPSPNPSQVDPPIEIRLDEKIGQVSVRKAQFFNGGKPDDDANIYRMKSNPRGLALILVIESFTDPKFTFRKGAKEDFRLSCQLFDQLGYAVLDNRNKTKTEFMEIVEKFTKNPQLKNVDSCVVAVSSHGEQNAFACTDSIHNDQTSLFNVEKLIAQFDNENCPYLRGKPKLFFIQACRGSQFDYGIARNVPDSYSPTPTDIFIAYPCQLGFVSFRNEEFGSWFFHTLTTVFMNYAYQDDYHELMRKVSSKISRLMSSKDSAKQAIELTMRGEWKQLYFNPGL